MKKILSCISICLVSAALYAGGVIVDNSVVSISTNSATASAANAARKEIRLYNADDTYDMYLSTAPVTIDNYETLGAYIIEPNSEFIDNGYVYKGAWYVCGSSTAISGKLHCMEKE